MSRIVPVLNKPQPEDFDPVDCPDGRQSPEAAAIQRGVCRALLALGHSVVTELVLQGGRRADVVGLSAGGQIWIVEIKSCLADFQADAKWWEYAGHCDRLYFAVNAEFPVDVLPQGAGLLLADRFGAEFMRHPAELPKESRLTAARRKSMTLSFARSAALRLQRQLDPFCGG